MSSLATLTDRDLARMAESAAYVSIDGILVTTCSGVDLRSRTGEATSIVVHVESGSRELLDPAFGSLEHGQERDVTFIAGQGTVTLRCRVTRALLRDRGAQMITFREMPRRRVGGPSR